MPKYRIDIPGQGSFEVDSPSELSDQQAYQSVLGQLQADKQREKATGFFPAVSSGITGLGGAIEGVKYGLGAEGSREKILKSQEKQGKQYQGPGWEDVEQAYQKEGIIPALGKGFDFAKGALGQSIPYMAAPAIGGAIGTAVMPGLGTAIGAGIGSLTQFFGSNIGRQVQEQEAAIQQGEHPQEISRIGALAAAAPQAAMDVFALGKIFKGTGMGRLVGMEGEEAAQKVANQILKQGGDPSKLAAIGKGAGRGVLAEVPTEVAQQVLERAQAGLSLTGEDAFKEYKEAMAGAIAVGGPLGTFGGAAERKAGISKAEKLIDEARGEFTKEFQQRAQLQAETEAQNLALEQPQLPGMEAPLVGPTGVRPEEVQQEAPAFELTPQGMQGELDVTTPQPEAPQEVAAAPIDNNFLKTAGLASAVGLKAKGKYSIVGLDLNDPQQAAKARENLTKVGETTKSGKIATAIEEALKSDPRLQEQPELGGFPSQAELDAGQVEKDQADAEFARKQRNQQYQSLLAEMEAENVAKQEAERVAREQADATKREQLARGVTEDITQVPFTSQVAPGQVPQIDEQPSAGVPSEVRAEDTTQRPEPSMGADVGPVTEPTPTDTEVGGRALGDVGGVTESGVQAPAASRGALEETFVEETPVEESATPQGALTQAETNRIFAGLRKEGLSREEAQQQVAEATPEELVDLAKLYAPIQTAAKTTAEQEAEITEATQAEGEFGDISARQVATPAPAVGMQKEQTQGIVDRLKQGWKRDVNVVVKNFADETPGRQAAMKARGLDTAKGYIDHDGTVVVLAENNKDEADVTATLFHETLGHLGLRLKFREELTNMMEKFYHTNADLKRAANKWLLDHKGEYDAQMPVAEKYAKAVEEVLAERAEVGRLPASIMDKIKAFINKWARKAGLNIDFSDAEIRSILDQAQKEVTEKAGEATTTPAKEIAPRAATTAADRLTKMGRSVKQVEDSSPFQEKVAQVKDVVKAPQKWRDLVETMVFSADAALNNKIRRALNDKLEQGGPEAADAMAKLYSISTSQALHNEAVANQFIEQGNVKYNSKLFKFEASKDENSWANMVQELKKIADQYGFTFPEMEAYAQAAIEARRLKGINAYNLEIEKEADALEAKGKKDAAETQREKLKFSHMTDEQIELGLEYFKDIPEINKITEMWNGIRKNAMTLAVDSGLYSKEEAEKLLEVMDYVPFYRVEQLESKAGPKEYSRGLLDAARAYKMKGSEQEVNNIFDNMERWASYTVRRAVNNKSAQEIVKVSQDVLQEAKEVPKAQRGMEANTVAIWQDGERKLYEFSDPLFVKAFTGLEPVALPAFKALSTFSNALRKNIVLNPLFSISQLSQDSFAAMLTSGLKNPWRLPIEVMKEFVGTLRNTSDAHKALKSVGAVGVRDYSAAISRLDAEMAAGLKAPTTWQKLMAPLEKFSMASDNAVRQAIYKMTMEETGGDKAKAIERAFEIINFRRKGASGTLAIAGQVIPFFNAYIQAQNVAYKVLTGRGVSPTARSEAKKVFIGNAAKIAALSFMYAAVMADDDDYKNMDPTIRDRHWIIPGTGLMLPTRTDLFSMPKIVAEHTYALMTDQGFEDGTKARRAMTDAVVNAITGPTPVPQAFKPLVEVVLNRNFYTGRPIIGRGIENLKTAEQFTASTSELSKAIGSTGLIAPVNADHLLRGYFGTTGGLTLMAMDAAINSASGTPKPAKSMQDTLASTPGLSTFVSKEFGNAAKTDFYELKGMVDEVGATLNRYQKTGRVEEAREYLGEEKTQNLLRVKQQVSQIQSSLAKLRERENLIRALPDTRMDADQKEVEIRKIRETEQRMLANVSKLRSMADL